MTQIAPHPELEARGSFAHLRLGKAPRKNDPRTLILGKYLRLEDLPAVPDAHDWSPAVASWPMYGNDKLGDCTCAAAGHMVEGWTANAGAAVVPADDAVEGLYWATGSADTGRFELDVLNYWRTEGLGTDKILVYAAVNPQSQLEVKTSIYLFGGLYIGVALPLTAQGQKVWDVVGDGQSGASAPNSWGGHAVNIVGYDAEGVTLVTWGGLMKATWAFLQTYCDEAYAIITQDWISAEGKAPSGIAMDELLSDLHQVENQETPSGITIGDDDGSPVMTIPVFPYEIVLNNASYWLQSLPDGSMILKFAPSQVIPGRGSAPFPPGIAIVFHPDGWAHFKERAAADGAEVAPSVEVARSPIVTPPGFGR